MIKPMYFIDSNTGATLHIAGFEMETSTPGTEPPYEPCRWVLLRRYTVPATGPAGHSWPAWSGAVAILLAVAIVLGRAL